ncbi:MAG: hypothetical protein PUD08_09505 [bacterium]|nr:hypothetical protein [bacterium]
MCSTKICVGTWGTLGTALQNRLGRDASCDPEVGGWPASGGRNELSVDWSVAIS